MKVWDLFCPITMEVEVSFHIRILHVFISLKHELAALQNVRWEARSLLKISCFILNPVKGSKFLIICKTKSFTNEHTCWDSSARIITSDWPNHTSRKITKQEFLCIWEFRWHARVFLYISADSCACRVQSKRETLKDIFLALRDFFVLVDASVCVHASLSPGAKKYGWSVGGCEWFWHHRLPSRPLPVPWYWQVLYCSSKAWAPKVPMC